MWKDWRNIETSSFDIYAQRVDSTGVAQWTVDGVPICTASSVQDNPAICGDGYGGAIIAWSGPDMDIYAQRVDSAGVPQWTADGVLVCATIGSYPVMLSDGSGGAFVTWTDSRNGASNPGIYAQRVSSTGALQWAMDGVAVCAAPRFRGATAMVSDGFGGVVVAWSDSRGPSLLGSYYADIYAQRIDSAGVTQWTMDGVAICTAPYNQGHCTMVGDGHGGATIAWQDGRRSNANEYYNTTDVYAQKIDSAGAPQWAADGVAICAVEYRQWGPEMVSDGDGGAIIAWADGRSYNPTDYEYAYDVYALRIDSAGAPQWAADGVMLCSEHGDSPEIVSDGSGGAVLCWQDSRNSTQAGHNSNDLDIRFGINDDVYAQRVNAGGEPQWGSNGVAICNAEHPQISPCMVSDGTGGAIIVWDDYRGGEDSGGADVYAQRVGASGALGSGSGGRASSGGPPVWAWIAVAAGVVAVAVAGLIMWRRAAATKRPPGNSSQPE